MTIAFVALRFLDRSLTKFRIEFKRVLNRRRGEMNDLTPHKYSTEIHTAHMRICLL